MATNEADETKSGGAQKRDRSPNYPAIPFSKALEYAQRIWNEDKRHPVPPDVLVKHMGYTKVSGATVPVVAALKRYGLLQPVGGKDCRITDDAHFIFVHPEGDPERKAMIRRLAMLPSLFGEVLEKYNGSLPSDAILRAKLQTDWAFASEAAANAFIKAIREAVSLQDGMAVVDPSDDGNNTGELTKDPRMVPPVDPTLGAPVKSPTSGGSPPPIPPRAQAGHVSRQWEIGDGRFVSISLPPDPTIEDMEALEEFLGLLKQEVALVWKRKGRTSPAQQ